MRKERRFGNSDNGFKKLMYISGGVLLIAVIAFVTTIIIYNNKVKNESRVSLLNSNKIAELVPSVSTEEDTTSASASIGKTVNEVQGQNNIENTIQNNSISNQSTNNSIQNATTNNTVTNNTITAVIPQKKELKFKMPVDGEISKEFSKDSLVYSETLKEWITHVGIDIKAEKTSVVKAAEEGTIQSIKNDPRYGLTVTIEHKDGYKTIYSNLLTAEFVSEGEEISRGQTIGTVGNTATFEISEEPHLHFEMLKDGEYVDPNIYIK